MSITHILVVEADTTLANKLKTSLERSDGVCVGVASGLREALSETVECSPDIIVIDLNAALFDGFEVTHILRCHQSISAKPVLMLRRTGSPAKSSELQPAIDETVIQKRLHHVLNPSQKRQLVPWILARYSDDRLTAAFAAARFWVDRIPVQLTVREQELLHVLVEQARRVVSRRDLEDRLWGYETRSLDVHIRRLRHKLRSAGEQIETVLGFGYRFMPCGESQRSPEPSAHGGTSRKRSLRTSRSKAASQSEEPRQGGFDVHY